MNRAAKNKRMQPEIDRIKRFIRQTEEPFCGNEYVFKRAMEEIRKEGIVIEYVKKRGYYIKKNPQRIQTTLK